jgi:hypothetical protein
MFQLWNIYLIVISLSTLPTTIDEVDKNIKETYPININELLPTKEELIQSLNRYYKALTHSQLEEYNYIERGKVLQYLPSIGYNFITNSPYVTYHTRLLFGAINADRLKKAKIKSIKMQMEIAFQTELEKLYRHYADLEAELSLYNDNIPYYQLQKELFTIAVEKYKNIESTPIEFITSKLAFINQTLKLKKQYVHIIKLKNTILDMAKVHPIEKLF